MHQTLSPNRPPTAIRSPPYHEDDASTIEQYDLSPSYYFSPANSFEGMPLSEFLPGSDILRLPPPAARPRNVMTTPWPHMLDYNWLRDEWDDLVFKCVWLALLVGFGWVVWRVDVRG
ncbi:hypothetical protein BU26DRAFT_557962 [Trematosphaeria pertusa]|uniref:Uncharacterized protein n=1 Tax=Trematosphaeria pertusa TaxID=390896 RepID=A0A6A6J1I5_9PLEO|nr:uncharacterized protein BU26DRAFT_557962 [Trematosphaeria pertusa]KAF2256516.1 hypothetical protein BU26DRAFT_557962 [Trematosphaeria pertusa]